MNVFRSGFREPTEQCSNLAPKIYFCYVSWLRICQLLQCWQLLFLRVRNWLFQEWEQSLQELIWKSTQFLTIWPFQICKTSLQLADLDQSFNLCYRFFLLDENYSRIWKSPPNLNIAPWARARGKRLKSLNKKAHTDNLLSRPFHFVWWVEKTRFAFQKMGCYLLGRHHFVWAIFHFVPYQSALFDSAFSWWCIVLFSML